jgi:CubicO group peptidase (beta-lactamase class C family)
VPPFLRKVDADVPGLMKAWGVPGLSVAVVQGGRVVYARGFGVRQVGGEVGGKVGGEGGGAQAVDARTVFPLCSLTKSFTAAALGQLVAEGKLAWDDPVVKHLPTFALHEEALTRAVTVRDLLAHRTGLPRANMGLLAPYGREEVLRRLQHVPPAAPLRTRFLYQNQGYLAAGALLEKLAGKPWEDVVAERLLAPLGMRETHARVGQLREAAAAGGNVALPHYRGADGAVRTTDFQDVDNTAPAGALNSTAEDMARWLQLHLAGGLVEGTAVLAPATVKELHTPQMLVPLDGLSQRLLPSVHFTAYGLGWFLRDYRGHKLVEHGGNLAGATAAMALLPEKGLGVVVLSNMDTSPLPQVLMYRVVDAALGGKGAELHAGFQALVREGEAKAAEARAAQEKARRADRAPTLPLARYAGAYTHPAYGEAAVTLEEGRLVLRFNAQTVGDLSPWEADTFRVTWRGDYLSTAAGQPLLTFSVAPQAAAEAGTGGTGVQGFELPGVARYARAPAAAASTAGASGGGLH